MKYLLFVLATLAILIQSAQAGYLTRGGLSGSWYSPERDGEGLVIHQIDRRRVLVYWFTYDEQGAQRWLIGTGLVEGDRVIVADLWLTEGPHFGLDFDPAALDLTRFGQIQLQANTCSQLSASWQQTFPEPASGDITLSRLTDLHQLACEETVEALSLVSWSATALGSPGAVAYAASTVHQGQLYLAGGAGSEGFRANFLRRSADGNWDGNWQQLPSLPEARIGAALVAHGQSLYYFGGSADTGFGGGPNCQALVCGELTGVGFRRKDAWRYDLGDNRWVELPQMPQHANMGGAVVLNQTIWVLDGWTTNLLAFDPQTETWKTHPGPINEPRAQSSLVTLDGELWLIGGRNYADEQRDVYVYSPLQANWRQGPRLREARAGHSAVVVNGQIVVSGGERWFGDGSLVGKAEVFAPGQTGWADLSEPLESVHGASAFSINEQAYLLGGSIRQRRAVPTDLLQGLSAPR